MNSPFNPPHVFGDGGAFGVGVGGSLPIGEFAISGLDNAYNAFPFLIENPDSSIDCYYYSGTSHLADGSVVKRIRSSNKGRSWSSPTTIFSDGTYGVRLGYGAIYAANGDLLVFVRRHDATNGIVDAGYIRSTDDGATFGSYTTIDFASLGFDTWGITYGRPFLVGTDLYVSGYGERSIDGGSTRSFLMKSTDNGLSYALTHASSAIGWGTNEACFYSSDGTNFVGAARVELSGNVGKLRYLRSTDGGVNWGTQVDWVHGVAPQIIPDPDGGLVLLSGRRVVTKGVDLWRSTDGGITWSRRKKLATTTTATVADFGYATGLFVDGKFLAIAYDTDKYSTGDLFLVRKSRAWTLKSAWLEDFETNPVTDAEQWQEELGTGTQLATISTSKAYSGSQSLRVLDNNSGASYGARYTINGGETGSISFRLNVINATSVVIIDLANNAGGLRFRFGVFVVSTDNRLRYFNSVGTWSDFATVTNLTADTWYKLTLTWDVTGTPTCEVFVNDVSIGSATEASGGSGSPRDIIFRSGSHSGTFTDFYLDDLEQTA